MKSEEIRKRFLAFFQKRDHALIPSASLVPEHDPSVLFTTAGMQPLVPYLLGEKHPSGKRLVNVQKCVRTQDIEEVGDKTHDTFFEMLGNWSLGDYFKKEAIRWSYEFLTSKEEGLGLDPERLYITVFEGNDDAPRDDESAAIWKKVGVPEHRIYYRGAEDNWWSPGDNGPSGPDTEMFYDVTKTGLGNLAPKAFQAADDAQEVVELWNDVFMQYEKQDGKVTGKLATQNVDTGAGLERLAMVMQGKNTVFETDLFAPLMECIDRHTNKSDLKATRIIADHIRTAVFIIGDGVSPSNTDRGYVVRRLIRRAVRYADAEGTSNKLFPALVDTVIAKYKDIYRNLAVAEQKIKEEILGEEERFRQTLAKGLREIERTFGNKERIIGEAAFNMYQTYGFPIELLKELADEKGIAVDEEGFRAEFKKHQERSRKGAEKKFKGGLADHSEMSVRYHTATHLLHQALRDVLGSHVHQMGSNITPERLRFDFNFDRKMTAEEIKRVEDVVNQKIKGGISVTHEDIPEEEAKKRGAIGLFEERYGDKVRVYSIGDYSLEYCGGPHVANTRELAGRFRIIKEEANARGVRRIKAVLEPEEEERA